MNRMRVLAVVSGMLLVAMACGVPAPSSQPAPKPLATKAPFSTVVPTATAGKPPTALPTDKAVPTSELVPIMTPTPTPTLPPVEFEACRGGADVVVLLVDPALVIGIRPALSQFETDLCAGGYAVVERRADFAVPPEVRAYLAELYTRTSQRLVGAVLIGDLPHAYQWFRVEYTNPSISPTEQEVISFQYYADLDGVFEASAGYVSPGGYSCSYDVHGGDVDWEIWIGVLPLYKGDRSQTVEALNRYFEKNHAYRAGTYDVPRAYLEIYEHRAAATLEEHNQILESIRSGEYAWTPFSDSPDAHIYFDSPPGGISVAQGYAALSEGVADFTVVSAHGTPSASGRIDIAWVESNPVRTVFFVSGACSAGNLDHADNFLTSILYSPTSMVLVSEGTTSESGGMGKNTDGFYGHNIATAMSRGEGFGQAMLSHVNVPLIYPWSDNREQHFSVQVILGDPTLALRP
jgi:hypothetical protein